VLQHEIIRLCNNILGFGTSVDTTNVIQIVLPEIYRKDVTETALEDAFHLAEVMMLEFKLGVLDPIPRLLVRVRVYGYVPTGRREGCGQNNKRWWCRYRE
jgi:hypothetical protein